mmetsp:Transcript_41759/g.66693  ORF Transcript_41759/g.66693 Transcript_41759/m.66693 type:complete len:222 (+) Transcript_41759:71-736(+)
MVLAEMLPAQGPPPQALLNQKWLWHTLCVLFLLVTIICLLGVMVSEALMSALMLWLACIMLHDGMHEMPRYAFVYGLLCCLNFFFDMLPLLTELNGRIQSQTEETTEVGPNGVPEIVYVVTTRKTPLFDGKLGLTYNLQTIAMFIMPITYGLGIYLGFSAHASIQQTMDDLAMGNALPRAGPLVQTLNEAQQAAPAAPRANTIEYFQGRSYKLETPQDSEA